MSACRAPRMQSRMSALAVSMVLAIIANAFVVSSVAAQGLTDSATHAPPTTGSFPYSPPGTWLPGQPGFPLAGQTYVDPVFGTTIRRLTNDFPNQSFSDIYANNGYWNADGTYWYHRRGSGWVILDTATGAIVRSGVPGTSTSDGLVEFDPVDPDVYYYYSGAQLRRYSVSAGTSSVVKTFPATLAGLGGSVDYVDRTGRYFLVNYSGALHIWDKQTDTIYSGSITTSLGAGWAGISPDGTYVIIAGGSHRSYPIDHAAQTLSSTATVFWTLCGDHGDLMSASDGKTYAIIWDCTDEPSVWRVDVSLPAGTTAQQKNQNVRLFFTDWNDAGHFSCASKGVNQDWCFVSIESIDDTFANQGAWRPYKQEIVMAQMVPPYTVRRLVQHRSRSIGSNYYYMPRVNANWDGTKFAWASNYGYNAGSVGYADIYIAELNVTNNLVPTVTSLSPTSTNAGGVAFTLTVNGTNFVSGSVVRWNSSARTTTFVSSTQLQAAITVGDIATVGTASVTVFSPTPGGGTSGALTFTINSSVPPGAATLVAPSGNIATGTPTFTWNAVAGATQYLLWVDDSSGGRLRTTYTAAQTGCLSGIGTCSIAPGAVLNPGAGEWWIVTSNAAGSGPWSSVMTFTVAGTPPPPAATIVAPSGSLATATPTFTWNAGASATQYLLWVGARPGGPRWPSPPPSRAGCPSGTGTCSLAPGATLNPGAGQWWVVTSNAAGSGPWSNGLSFTVPGTPPPPAATIVAPSGSLATATPTFTWNAVASATAYMLWVDDSSGGRSRATYTAAQAGCTSGTGTCSLAPGLVLNPGAGQWWVVTSNASGSGPWSNGLTFTVAGTPPPPAATLVAPSGSIATKTPTYTWNAVAGATQYLLWVDDSSGGRIRTTYTAAQAGCASRTGTRSVTPSVVLASGAGVWWVVTGNASGNGPWSSGMTFTAP